MKKPVFLTITLAALLCAGACQPSPDTEIYNPGYDSQYNRPDLKPADTPADTFVPATDDSSVYISTSDEPVPIPLDFDSAYRLCNDFLTEFYTASTHDFAPYMKNENLVNYTEKKYIYENPRFVDSVKSGLVMVEWHEHAVLLELQHIQTTIRNESSSKTPRFLIRKEQNSLYIADWYSDFMSLDELVREDVMPLEKADIWDDPDHVKKIFQRVEEQL